MVETLKPACGACNGTGRFRGIFSSDPHWPPCPVCSRLSGLGNIPREWFERKAAEEGDLEIGVGPQICEPASVSLAIEPVAWRRMNPQGTQSTGVTDTEFYRDEWAKTGVVVEALYSATTIQRLAEERDAAIGWAGDWHRIVDTICTVLGLGVLDPPEVAEAVRAKFTSAEAEIAKLRETNQKLHRRVQAAEAFTQAAHDIPDCWRKIYDESKDPDRRAFGVILGIIIEDVMKRRAAALLKGGA